MHDVTLAILCGGQSRRLGTDKGLYAPLGDEALITRALRLLGAPFKEILIVVRSSEQRRIYQKFFLQHGATAGRQIRLVHDEFENHATVLPQAALTGINTALLAASMPQVLAVPVDQLGVRILHLNRMLEGSRQMPLANCVTFATETGDPVPFPSLWRALSQPQVEARLKGGALSVKGTIRDMTSHVIGPPTNDHFDQELSYNANTVEEMLSYFGTPLHDSRQRRLHYLRFSLTEACNMACTYCLPDGFPEWYRHKARLTLPQIKVLLEGFRRLGFRKVRFTGGEPTIHPDCLESIRIARRLGFEKIAITTNGLLMGDLNQWLEAGLTHLNVSLDSLDPEIFKQITQSSQLAKVTAVIEQGLALGLSVKINTVLMKSVNGSEQSIMELIEWALKRPLTLRFIELMDTRLNAPFASSERVLGSTIEPLLRQIGLAPTNKSGKTVDTDGPAVDFNSSEYPGTIGLINPMSGNFCNKCNRLRVTAKGHLKLCLFGDNDTPLDHSSPDAVALNVRQLIGTKPERHYLDAGNFGNVATFRTIGG